jgi:hypothetical protein
MAKARRAPHAVTLPKVKRTRAIWRTCVDPECARLTDRPEGSHCASCGDDDGWGRTTSQTSQGPCRGASADPREPNISGGGACAVAVPGP